MNGSVAIRTTSFRAQLKGTLSDFLRRESMQCIHTEEALLELVVSLSHYTEEGNLLFPQILICDDLPLSLSVIQGSEPIEIGKGPKSTSTAKQALKRCAPLSHDGWVTYIHRDENNFIYGVFRAPFPPTALDIRDTILSLSQEEQEIKMILASQLSEKSVELIGSSSGCLHLHLSAMPEDSTSPRMSLEAFIELVCADVEENLREQVNSFLRTSLFNANRQCHGTLLAIIANDMELVADLREDGVTLSEPIEISHLVYEHQKLRDDSTNSALNAYAILLAGMLSIDGIVLFNDKANILGYNFFIKQAEDPDLKPRELVGGARRRAYQSLCHLVDEGKLRGCYMQSSDGASSFYGGNAK